jgi:uncharacterized membrane protein
MRGGFLMMGVLTLSLMMTITDVVLVLVLVVWMYEQVKKKGRQEANYSTAEEI